MPSGLFSLRLTFEISKSESLRDVSVTRIGDTFPQTDLWGWPTFVIALSLPAIVEKFKIQQRHKL